MINKIEIAPMMDWTDRHCRYFMRLLNPHVRLYTEMITAAALRHGNTSELLKFDQIEHPVALQIGGSDPDMMAEAALAGEVAGYDEININVGCPSDRVQNGQFGACLMANPELVAACVRSMRAAIRIPVTIKTRIGIDDQDSYEFLHNFVQTTHAAGCDSYIIHARKAILSGLSPKENRTVPPLVYERVYRLKRDMPALKVTLNGGVTTAEEIRTHLRHVDGVMLGRQAYLTPWLLAELQRDFAADDGTSAQSRHDIVQRMIPYIRKELAAGAELKHITRHMLGLFAGQPGARAWRRFLSEQAHRRGAGTDIVESALAQQRRAA